MPFARRPIALSVEPRIDGRFPVKRGVDAREAAGRRGALKVLIEPDAR